MKQKLTYRIILLCILSLAVKMPVHAEITAGKTYKINSCYPGAKALFMPNASLNDAVDVVSWTETNVPAQRWITSSAGEGLFYLTNAYSERPISESSTRPKPGDRLILKSNNSNYSKWEFIPVQNAAYPNAYYISFSIKGTDGNNLYVELPDNTDGSQVKLQSKRTDADSLRQMWTLVAEDILPNRVTHSFRDSVMRGWKSRYYNILKTSTGFWGEAEMMETILDAYETTGKQEYKTMFEEVYAHFVSYPAGWGQPGNGLDWRWNEFNDDIAWAVLASVRAYMMFGQHPNSGINYLTIAKNNYDWMYARALLPSGMLRWKQTPTGNQGSNSCINGPAEIAACYLAIATGDDSYYTKAKDLYALQRQYLYEPSTGKVFDSGSWSNGVFTIGNHWVSTYNQGTFLGAALMLYQRYGETMYLNDAHKIAERTRLDLCNASGVINVCGSGDDLQGFKGILMRYLRRYIVDLGLPDKVEWMQRNALQAYNNRNSAGVIWTAWWVKSAENYIFSDGYNFSNKAFGTSTAVSAAFNAPLSPELIIKDAFKTMEAENFDYLRGVIVERSDDTTAIVGNIADGYYTAYNHVDFGSEQPAEAVLRIQGSRQSGRTVEIRIGSPSGSLIGTAEIPSANTGEWVTVNCQLQEVSGRQNIYLVYRGSGYKIDHFHFLRGPNGTKNIGGSSPLKVYPNPVKDNLLVHTPYDGRLYVYDMEGNETESFHVTAGETNINVSAYNAGLYLLGLRSGKGMSYTRFLKQ
jgi:predicted alpha-1,6-mannanase (GH76 family)